MSGVLFAFENHFDQRGLPAEILICSYLNVLAVFGKLLHDKPVLIVRSTITDEDAVRGHTSGVNEIVDRIIGEQIDEVMRLDASIRKGIGAIEELIEVLLVVVLFDRANLHDISGTWFIANTDLVIRHRSKLQITISEDALAVQGLDIGTADKRVLFLCQLQVGIDLSIVLRLRRFLIHIPRRRNTEVIGIHIEIQSIR